MRSRSITPFLVLSLLLGSCRSSSSAPAPNPAGGPVEATSLLGRELHRPAFSTERTAELTANLRAAEATYRADPADVEAAIWYGRRLAYLGRYEDAVRIYGAALVGAPEEPKLLRHRGHRWITLRRFDSAVRDLARAAALTDGRPDEVEPDGAPNAAGIPTSTLKSNIWYHLALARYLQGDFARAGTAWMRCLHFAKNDDMLCATTHWLYMSLRRLGHAGAAQAVLRPIHADMTIRENFAYHELLLMYKGERTPEEVLGGDGGSDSVPGLEFATRGYGVANWYLYNGDEERALAMFQRIVDETSWPAFGHIAAEAELARRR